MAMEVSRSLGSSQQNLREPKRGNKMIDHVGCRMKVITLDGRTYSGVLKAFDKFMNLVLDECKLIDVPEETSAQTEPTPGASGFVLMRGEQIVAMCVLEPRPPSSDQEKHESRTHDQRDSRPSENRSRSYRQEYRYDDGRSRDRTHHSPRDGPDYHSLGSPSPRGGQGYRSLGSPSSRDGPDYRSMGSPSPRGGQGYRSLGSPGPRDSQSYRSLGSPSPRDSQSYRGLGSPGPRDSQSYRSLGSPSSYYSGGQDSHIYEGRGSRRESREMDYERNRDRGYIPEQERDYGHYDRHGHERDYGRSRDYDYYSRGRRY